MEVYSPLTDNAYENRSDGASTVVNKRRNYENLQRSIQAHKNRLAMARLKKGKNLPGDDFVKTHHSGDCRQSTSDTNENYEPYRFRRHTQSSLNKITKPASKYNSLSSSNSFDGRYENERLYIKKYDDFENKVNQSMVKYNTNLEPKLSHNSDFSFDPNSHVNRVEMETEELEKKVLEILGKLLLKKEAKPESQPLLQDTKTWSQKEVQNNLLTDQRNRQPGNHDQVVDLLTKCISTTLNTASNDAFDNLSSARTSKSVNVEINLNMPPSKPPEPTFTMNVNNTVEEVGDVFIENVFNRDTKIVEENIFKRAYDKVKCMYLPEKKNRLTLHPKRCNTENLRPNLTYLDPKHQTVFLKTKKAHTAWLGDQKWKQHQNNGVSSNWSCNQRTWRNVCGVSGTNPCGWTENNTESKTNVKPVHTPWKEQNVGDPVKTHHMSRKNSFADLNGLFRPFSRSRSQSLHLHNKKIQSNPTTPRTNHPLQPNRPPTRHNTSVPMKATNCTNIPKNVQMGRAPQPNHFISQQPTDVGVDHSFDPFNLRQKFNLQHASGLKNTQPLVGWNNNPVVNNWKNDQEPKGWIQKPENDTHPNKVNTQAIVKRNNSFNFFSKRNSGHKRGNQELLASYNANFTERFERSGVNCMDTLGRARQGTIPRISKTPNTNNKQWNEQQMPNFRIPQSAKSVGAPRTPNTFAKIKRINTDPKLLNKMISNHNTFLNHKQQTEDLNFNLNQQSTKLKLLESKSVINTLNSLSRLNTMY